MPSHTLPPSLPHLVDTPNTMSEGNFGLLLDDLLSDSSLRRMSLVRRNCVCSCAVVRPQPTAALLRATKSRSGVFRATDHVGWWACQFDRAVWRQRGGRKAAVTIQRVLGTARVWPTFQGPSVLALALPAVREAARRQREAASLGLADL